MVDHLKIMTPWYSHWIPQPCEVKWNILLIMVSSYNIIPWSYMTPSLHVKIWLTLLPWRPVSHVWQWKYYVLRVLPVPSNMVDQETMILRFNMRQWFTKVIKPYYNHVETWQVKWNNSPNNVKQGKNKPEHGCTCYHDIVHHRNTIVLKLPCLTMIRL